MVNLIVGFPIWSRPCIFMNVAMWEHRTFDSVLDVAKFTNLIPLSLLISCKLFIPNCRFKNVFLAYFGIEIS
jgi:hypothetical protein